VKPRRYRAWVRAAPNAPCRSCRDWSSSTAPTPAYTEADPRAYFREQEQARLRGEEDRADDTEDVILNRMKVYRDETAPLLDYYNAELKTVDAVGTVDEAFARALRALGK
jgi:adenylate kinase family enzyme